jgi:hypothetical protein
VQIDIYAKLLVKYEWIFFCSTISLAIGIRHCSSQIFLTRSSMVNRPSFISDCQINKQANTRGHLDSPALYDWKFLFDYFSYIGYRAQRGWWYVYSARTRTEHFGLFLPWCDLWLNKVSINNSRWMPGLQGQKVNIIIVTVNIYFMVIL